MPTSNVVFAGRQHDLVLASDDEGQLPILIECKYHDPQSGGTVGVKELEDFAGRVLRLRTSGDISSGYLVTNTGFTAQALGALHNRPEQRFVLLKTVIELRRELISFDRYLQALVERYEQSNLDESFEPLYVTSVGSGRRRSPDAADALLRFAREPNTRLCVLTGDYGTGKTTVCGRIAYLLAKDIRTGGSGRIPVVIPLKWYSQAGGAAALIQRFLDEAGLHHANVDAFLAMHGAGQLLLIFDGFDEMLRRATGQSRRETIQDLVDLCVPGTKMVLTGRAGYFVDEAELQTPFRGVGISGVGERLRRIAEPNTESRARPLRRYEMQPLDPGQVKAYIARKLGGAVNTRSKRAATIVHTIETTYNLADLARRPILLDMITETLGRGNSSRIASPAGLYRTYVDTWLAIDADKGAIRGLMSPADRLSFSIALAWIFQDFDQQEIHWRELQRLVGTYFRLDEADDVDHFGSDVRTSTFLQRDDQGNFRFAHLSFQEYFCARFLVEGHPDLKRLLQVILENADISLVALADKSASVLDFAGDMIGCPINPFFWRFIREGIAGNQERIQKAVERHGVGPTAGDLHFLLQMADGDASAFELSDMSFAYRNTYLALRSILQRMVEERTETWAKLLYGVLQRGRLTRVEVDRLTDALQ